MRQEKQLLLDDISDKVAGSKAFLITRYSKLTPNVASNFRLELAKAGGNFAVVRKRILLKAAEGKGVALDREILQGHIGVVLAYDDPIQTAKAVYKFSKENEEILEVLGGQFEGVLYSAKDVKALSELPSKDEMRAQLLATFEAPMAQTLSVMDALLTSLLYCLENKAEKND